MDQKVDRRQFIGGSIAGMAAAASLSFASGSANARVTGTGAWSPPSDEERRSLISTAEFGRKKSVAGKQGVAICTHPLATSVAIDILEMGGNACDAICAASLAQTVVEPHMTTLSGVFSMLHYDARSGSYSYVNGSMNAPKAHPIFKGGTKAFEALVMSGQRDGTLVPVPGFWGGVEASHGKYGRLPMKTVMAPAIHYARHGFEIHPFLWGEMFVESSTLGAVAQGQEMYFKDRRLLNVGEKLVQSRHADTLERLAEEGSDYFYRGEFARKYAEAVQKAGGFLTIEDMEAWRPIIDEPVRSSYRDYELIAAPAPDFGGQALIEIMNMIELMDVQKLGPAYASAETTRRLLQIIKKVYADAATQRRNGAVEPVEKMISKALAAQRFASLDEKPAAAPPALAPPGSAHITVVDADGNVATVLHSVMSMPYTTGIFVDGVYVCAGLLHLASGTPGPDGRVHSRIAPNIFARDGKPVLASGSPSVSLTENIVQNTMNMLDFGLDIEASVHKPRFGGSDLKVPGANMIEVDMGQDLIGQVRARGEMLVGTSPWDWMHGSFDGIRIAENGMASACGDPRRTAQAMAR
ncbi:gamma-glutamyltransferase [Sphingosinicella rhizophila]|uniref:Gamma-glutamyltransferase n=1 Tax=Sphingosinicella rhizophila TaxID=3050082 RepID=A0ABU3Q214_9SPHN|nr:gamma-glutamyltransferase [Sphingosinicella sp. GR2756]MDT9597455.1 gamma-glutamyltransferase [Sphingosinicella sp. GR2756]